MKEEGEEEEAIKVEEEEVVAVVPEFVTPSKRANAQEALHADSHTKELEVYFSGLFPLHNASDAIAQMHELQLIVIFLRPRRWWLRRSRRWWLLRWRRWRLRRWRRYHNWIGSTSRHQLLITFTS